MRRLICLSASPRRARDAEAFGGGCLTSMEDADGSLMLGTWYRSCRLRWEMGAAAVDCEGDVDVEDGGGESVHLRGASVRRQRVGLSCGDRVETVENPIVAVCPGNQGVLLIVASLTTTSMGGSARYGPEVKW